MTGGLDDAGVAAALRDMLLVTLKLGGPPLLAALAVGLVVSVLQAVTQISEQTLAFVPKVAAVVGALALLGPFMLSTLRAFAQLLFDRLVVIGGS